MLAVAVSPSASVIVAASATKLLPSVIPSLTSGVSPTPSCTPRARSTAPSRALRRRSSTLIGVDVSALSDEDLLERIAHERDSSAFETLYQRYSRAIYSVVRRSLSDHGRSEGREEDDGTADEG